VRTQGIEPNLIGVSQQAIKQQLANATPFQVGAHDQGDLGLTRLDARYSPDAEQGSSLIEGPESFLVIVVDIEKPAAPTVVQLDRTGKAQPQIVPLDPLAKCPICVPVTQ